MKNDFTAGDILMVQPQDTDDPEALAHAGQRCRFLRSVPAAIGGRLAVVQFSTQGRGFYLRPGDLVRTEERLGIQEEHQP